MRCTSRNWTSYLQVFPVVGISSATWTLEVTAIFLRRTNIIVTVYLGIRDLVLRVGFSVGQKQYHTKTVATSARGGPI